MRRTWVIGAGLAAVVATAALWQATHRSGRSNDPVVSAAVSTTPLATPTSSVGSSLPAGVQTAELTTPGPLSEKDAVRAAVRFLELDEELFPAVSPARARELSDSIASSAARTRLGDRAEANQRERLSNGDRAELVLRIAPITARVRNLTAGAAKVDVYFVKLWSFPGKGVLDDYATVQIDLVAEGGQWRLSDSSVIDGPYPVARFSARPVIASSAARYEEILAGFDDTDLIP